MRQVSVRPVTLAVAPGTATTPGYPGQLALQLGGFHVRAYLRKSGVSAAGSHTADSWEQRLTRVRPWQ